MSNYSNNGWFNINEHKPKSGDTCIVILEREASSGCTYMCYIEEDIYQESVPKGYFMKEDKVWHVKYWREKVSYPYPDEVVMKEIKDRIKHNYSIDDVVEYQMKFGIEVKV